MKKHFYKLAIALLSITTLSFTGCMDSTDIPDYMAEDIAKIDNYLNGEEIEFRTTGSGVRIVTLEEGSSDTNNYLNKILDIEYITKVFSEDGQHKEVGKHNAYKCRLFLNSDYNVYDGAFIAGFSEALADLHQDETAEIYIPSPLAYANIGFNDQNGNELIPSHSTLVIEAKVKAARTDEEYLAYEIDSLENYIINELELSNASEYLQSDKFYKITTEEGDETAALIEEENTVTVSYTGKRLDGTEFDSTDSYTFSLNSSNFITGWGYALKTMRKGETATILLPSSLAYGETGSAPQIAPFTPLIFEITIKDVESNNNDTQE